MGPFDDLLQQAPQPPPAQRPNAFADLISEPTAAPTAAAQDGNGFGRAAGLALRSVIEGATALPVLAGDVGIGLGNTINQHLPDYRPENQLQLPSVTLRQTLNRAGLPEPHGFLERTISAVESGLTGSAMPMPEITSAPSNFVSPQEAQIARRAANVRDAQDAGYVIPPSTTNPTASNRVLETLAGKQSTQQSASATNQAVTNNLAKRALGQESLSAKSLSALRSEAGANGYEPIRAAGTVTAPSDFSSRLRGVLSQYQGAERSFPGMGQTTLSDIIAKVDRPKFDAGDAIDLTKILRDKASIAYANGDKATWNGLRQISGIVEDALDRGLQAKGSQYAAALDNFRNARSLIAKTYSVQDALNPGSENISARVLGSALRKEEPLTGELRTIGRFANAFPKAAAEPTSSNIHHLDTAGTLLTGLLGEHLVGGPAGIVAGAAYPLARYGARAYLLGPGQSGAIPRAVAQGIDPRKIAALVSALSGAQPGLDQPLGSRIQAQR